MGDSDVSNRVGAAVAGLSALGALLAGVFALLSALDADDPEAKGLLYLASAVAFGLLANAAFRK